MSRWQWNPVPLRQPHPPSFLSDLPWPKRIAEVLRYGLLAFEYSLSPGGGLRAWLKLNMAVAVFLGIPALLLVPVITVLVTTISTWTALLLQIVLNLLYAALALMALVFVLMFVTRLLFARR
jgi:hypothetical protein